jgi:ribosomal protein S18 acetylase RimI-like enzyme
MRGVWNSESVAGIRRAREDDGEACAEIVRQLPDHFTEDVPDRVTTELGEHGGWVFVEAGRVVAFVVVERRSERAAEILWIAVRPSDRGSGIGTALLDHLKADLARDGVALLEVKTLDRSAAYEPYEATVAFWESRGFIQIDMIDPLPGRPPGNPAAIYVVALAPTR